ncbi:MAG: helix-turn-helix domain-containing protein [Caulobacter sp.]|nr:helix-turn-helix domain-containing protein [Caulobacter sp.]
MTQEHNDLLSPAAAARRLGVSEQWLEDARRRRVGPPVHRLGYRTVRYAVSDLDAFVASRRQVVA